MISQVVQGLEALHDSGIVHGDIKPENIFVSRDGSAWHDTVYKIGDFGLAQDVEGIYYAQVGTPGYMAPEVTQAHRRYGTKADVWSAGVVLLETMKGFYPVAKVGSVDSVGSVGKGKAGGKADTAELFKAAFDAGESQAREESPIQPKAKKKSLKVDTDDLFAAAFGAGESAAVDGSPRPSLGKDTESVFGDGGEADMLDQLEEDPGYALLLSKDPKLAKRFPEGVSLLQEMLQVEQGKRASCTELMAHPTLSAYGPAPGSPRPVAL